MIIRAAVCVVAALSGTIATSVSAQSRDQGWEVGAQLIYQDAQDLAFDGGTTASLDSDLGLAISFGYRVNDRLEFEFGVDWNTVDYDVTVFGATPAQSFSGRGDLESFTPHVNANFNLLTGPLTPYVSGGVGWSFIDTNIPNGPPQTSCWWHPWYGYICDTWQSTRTSDELTYSLGVGVRWDLTSNHMVRLGYEKHWLDLDTADGTPDFDQLRFSIVFKY
jgi:opacity protein-like surface antigen